MTAFGIPLCLVASGLLIDACSKDDQKPADLLNQEEMVRVMAELYLTEQKISTLGIKRDSLKQVFSVMKERIFTKAGTTDSVFKRSLNYYMSHPKVIEGIYTALIDSLNLHEQQMISNEVKK
jgi:hypothetical protein